MDDNDNITLIERLASVWQGRKKKFQLNVSLLFLYQIVKENSKSTVMSHFLSQIVCVFLTCKYI